MNSINIPGAPCHIMNAFFTQENENSTNTLGSYDKTCIFSLCPSLYEQSIEDTYKATDSSTQISSL